MLLEINDGFRKLIYNEIPEKLPKSHFVEMPNRILGEFPWRTLGEFQRNF